MKTWLNLGIIIIIACFGVFLAFNHAHQTTIITSDSITYIDAARHMADGLGYRTSLLSFSDGGSNPSLTLWPPFYAMTITPLISANIDPIYAGRIISALAYGLLIIVIGLWIRSSKGPLMGVVAATILLTLPALIDTATTVLSESLYTLVFIISVWLGWIAIKHNRLTWWFIFGLVIGLSALTKYLSIVLVALIPIAALILAKRNKNYRSVIKPTLIGLAGAALFILPLLMRNVMLGQPLGGGERLVSTVPFLSNIGDTVKTLAADFSSSLLWIAISISTLLALIIIIWRRKFLRSWKKISWPLIAAATYTIGLIVIRSVVHVDRIYTRYLMPIYPLIIFIVIILLWDAIKIINGRWANIAMGIAAIIFLAWGIKTYDFQAGKFQAEPTYRARVVQKQTTENDLIIGNIAREYNLYLGRDVIQLYSDERSPQLTTELTRELTHKWSSAYNRIIIAVTPDLHAESYGEYVASLSRGEKNDLELLEQTDRVIVYEVPR
ncbi:ArnT family glycosyltransferase [Patescibacteria group bacterium]